MDKGIRPAAREKFVELNEKRRRNVEPYIGAKANTIFRKEVMGYLMENFGISLASAATHYNEAFKLVKEATPELVAGLGRPEDKKGGRKPKVQPTTGETPATTEGAGAESPKEQTEEPAPPPPVLYIVKKKKDGSEVAKGLTREQAEELLEAAKKAKKAALEMVEQ